MRITSNIDFNEDNTIRLSHEAFSLLKKLNILNIEGISYILLPCKEFWILCDKFKIKTTIESSWRPEMKLGYSLVYDKVSNNLIIEGYLGQLFYKDNDKYNKIHKAIEALETCTPLSEEY